MTGGVRRTTLLTWAPGATADARRDVVAVLEGGPPVPGVLECWARPTMAGVVRGGDLVWRLSFTDDAARTRWDGSVAAVAAAQALGSAAVAAAEAATYAAGRTGRRELPGSRPVHRSLLLRAEADEETLTRFEDELFAMGTLVPVMREWRLSRIAPGQGGGSGWTHAWEQVFPDVACLERAYMRHPYHWGQVDRWFDGESPDRIVLPTFAHTFCPMPGPSAPGGW